MLSKNNKSGVKGVCFETRANKWRAYIGFAGEKIRLGYFSNFDEAVVARQNAEVLYGKFKGDLVLYAKNRWNSTGISSISAINSANTANTGDITSSLIMYAIRYFEEDIADMWSYSTFAIKNIDAGLVYSKETFGSACNEDDIKDFLEEKIGIPIEDVKLFMDFAKGVPTKKLTYMYSLSKTTIYRHVLSIANLLFVELNMSV